MHPPARVFMLMVKSVIWNDYKETDESWTDSEARVATQSSGGEALPIITLHLLVFLSLKTFQ